MTTKVPLEFILDELAAINTRLAYDLAAERGRVRVLLGQVAELEERVRPLEEEVEPSEKGMAP